MTYILEHDVDIDTVRTWCTTALPGVRVEVVLDAFDDDSVWDRCDVLLSYEKVDGGVHLKTWKPPSLATGDEQSHVAFAFALCDVGAPSVLALSRAMLQTTSPYFSLRVSPTAVVVVDDSHVDVSADEDADADQASFGWDLAKLVDVGEVDRGEVLRWVRGERGPLPVPSA